MEINVKRLEENLAELAKIGRNAQGGIDRALGDATDREAREWLCRYWKENLGLQAATDGIANLWLEQPGTEALAPLAIGSHHDAVPNGGMYDGALGVLMATEIMQTLQEAGVKTRHPLRLVSFTGEEPNPFNVSTLGSKVACGRLKKADLEKLYHRDTGKPLQETLLQIGGDLERVDEALIKPGQIAAFLECHVELGRRLFDKGIACSGVDTIIGIYRENVVIEGDANHAGTTVMRDRQDALLAASELMLAFERIVKEENSDDVVGTCGYISVSPNEANIIPGRVELTLELRTSGDAVKERVVRALDAPQQEIMQRRRVKIERNVNLDQPAMPLDQVVRDAVADGVRAVGEPFEELVSMAGHDAANMARVTRSGMIFAQSIDGKGHCPYERTDIRDIEKTANAMLAAVLKLDKELTE